MKLTRSGFSFVEIMMVVFMLCICILPLMGYIQHGTRQTAQTQDRSLAMTLTSQTMERYRALGYDELNTLCGSSPLTDDGMANDPMMKLDNFPPELKKRIETEQYKRTVTFKDIPDPRVTGPAAATAKVGLLTVQVEWTPLKTPPAKMTLCKIITARQP